MTPALKVAGGQPVWTRDSIHEYMRDYASLYGADAMTAAAFNPSTAKWRDDALAVERYYAGNPLRGDKAWPSLNTVKKFHDGSFNAARVAAGFEPNTPGPASRRRARHAHSPVRNVVERVQTRVVERTADPRWGARVSAPQVKVERVEVPAPGDARLRKAVERAERRLATATERLRDAREKARTARLSAAARAREAKAAEGRTRRTEASLAAARAEATELARASEAQTREVERLTAQLAASETAARAQDERIVSLEGDIERLREQVAMSDPRELARISTEVETARARVASATAAKRHAEQLAGDAARERRGAEARADAAQRAAAQSEAERVRVQRAVAGHTRPLTPAEIAALRKDGPQGPAVFMQAVKMVVKAQTAGQREPLRNALRQVASAAVSWAERL